MNGTLLARAFSLVLFLSFLFFFYTRALLVSMDVVNADSLFVGAGNRVELELTPVSSR